jgi:glycerate 2-kinase
MARQTDLESLRRAAREIFSEALKCVDAGDALKRALHLEGSELKLFDAVYNLSAETDGIYAVAIGKAALHMATALEEILGSRLTAGVVAAPCQGEDIYNHAMPSSRWRVFAGGHPLPNQASLDAARAAIALLRRADRESALIIFLISGGGSATFEWPRDERLTLREMREANRALVSCGATIAEINSVRRAFSAVKGGGLSAFAPHARQLCLIVSDTNPGDEATVASGPTFRPPSDAPVALDVISRHHLEKRLPPSFLRAIREAPLEGDPLSGGPHVEHYLLLDNRSVMEAARRAALARGFSVAMAADVIEQPVAEGCPQLLARLYAGKAHRRDKVLCLISGGEFACPVRGEGTGGRNAETALRCALLLDERRRNHAGEVAASSPTVILSAGTDGIDGNSPAAGALADETSIERARAQGMEAQSFLERSDAYTFFEALGDTVMTGQTGTNVRDLRIMLAA